MCKPKEHVFLAVSGRPPFVGSRCICGLYRWGTDAQLRALDEIVVLERMLQLPERSGR